MSEDERDTIEILLSDFLERRRQGDKPTIDEYAARAPERAEEIHAVFPAMLAMEQLKQRKEMHSGGRVSSGPKRLKKLGEFDIVREIGRGGMGIVYEARQASLNRRVALKVLPGSALQDEKRIRRFRKEALLAATLHHPNIVPVFGVGEEDGHHYYAMQYIEGRSLDFDSDTENVDGLAGVPPADSLVATRLIDEPSTFDLDETSSGRIELDDGKVTESPFTPDEVVRLSIQAASALRYAHESGVLHRDIKPANLILDDHQNLWIADFGLARGMDERDMSQTGQLVGTLRYLPPERLQGEADGRSDLYSLGLTIYELLAGRPAWGTQDRTKLIQQITTQNPPSLQRLCPQLPRDLITIVEKSIAREPERRYQSAAAMAGDLKRFHAGEPIHARRVRTPERLWLWARRNPAVAVLSGTVVVLTALLLIVGTIDYWQVRQENTRVTIDLQSEQQRRRDAEQQSEKALAQLDVIFERLRTRTAPDEKLPDGAAAQLTAETELLTADEIDTLESLLQVHQALASRSVDNPRIAADVAASTRRLGDIQRKLGHFDEALSLYTSARDRYAALKGAGDSAVEFLLDQATISNDMGLVRRLQGQAPDAIRDFETAEQLLTNLDATKPRLQSAIDYQLCRTWYLLAQPPGEESGPAPPPPLHGGPPVPSPFGDQTRQAEAEKLLRRSVDRLLIMRERTPKFAPAQHLLARCYARLLTGSPFVIQQTQEKSIALMEDLRDRFPREPEYLADLLRTMIATQVGPPGVVDTRLRRAWKLSEDLISRFPPTPRNRLLRVTIGFQLGTRAARGFRPDEAQPILDEALSIITALAEEQPEVEMYRVWRGCLLIERGRAGLAPEMLPDSEELVRSGIALLTPFADGTDGKPLPDAGRVNGMLWDGWLLLAFIMERQGESGTDARTTAERYRLRLPAPPPPPRPGANLNRNGNTVS